MSEQLPDQQKEQKLPLLDLEEIGPPAEGVRQDEKAERELNELKREKLKAEVESFQQDTKERKRYANLVFRMICVWLSALFVLLFLVASLDGFQLSDKVVIALITGTTVNVLGIFVVVMNYLFRK